MSKSSKSLNWKLSPEFLLEQLALHTKTDMKKFRQELHHRLGLKHAVIADTVQEQATGTTPAGNPRHKKAILWTTPTAVIESTEYGRITRVEYRRKSQQPTTPIITHKKTRTIQRDK